MSDFDWFKGDDVSCVVIPEQPATAVYTNSAGSIVVRQQGDALTEDDPYIFVWPAHALALVRAILKEAGIDGATLDWTDRTTPRKLAPVGAHPLGTDIGWIEEAGTLPLPQIGGDA